MRNVIMIIHCAGFTNCLAFALLPFVAILKPKLSKPLTPTTRTEGLPELRAALNNNNQIRHCFVCFHNKLTMRVLHFIQN